MSTSPISDEELLRMMQRGWRGGKGEKTDCGRSSMMEYTKNIRAWLPMVCTDYGIATVNDAGAGDLHWMQHMHWNVDYNAYDLVPRHSYVKQWNILEQPLPPSDAILCRMVLNHFDKGRVAVAIENFRLSAKYLIATHFVGDNINCNREFTRLDLTQWLGKPLETCRDGHEDNCRLALWSL